MSRDVSAPVHGSVGRKTTVAQLARRLDVGRQDVSKAAQRVLNNGGTATLWPRNHAANQSRSWRRTTLRGDPHPGRTSAVCRSHPVEAPSHGRIGSEQLGFPGNTCGHFRELRPQRRFDHLAVPADEHDAIVLDRDVEGTVMQQPVMRAA